MTVTWSNDERFRVDGVDFVCSFDESTTELFCIRKPRRLVEETVRRLEELRPSRVVELGIAQGGSMALTALVARPAKLIAIELACERVRALDELIAGRSWQERVRPYYGVDQSSRERLTAIAEAELGDAPADLVIDDASHVLDPTRASFEVLFPLLRPGGLYVIEDWNWHQKFVFSLGRKVHAGTDGASEPVRTAFRDYLRENLVHPPLESLVLELVVALGLFGDALGDLSVGEGTVVVERGPGVLEPGSFRIADTYVDPRGLLAH